MTTDLSRTLTKASGILWTVGPERSLSVDSRAYLCCYILCILVCGPCAQMVTIPGGSFQMGSSRGEIDETPVHTVRLSEFRMDQYEVTKAEYDSCVADGACTRAHYSDGRCIMWTSSGPEKVRVPKHLISPGFPVVCVDWYQARQYCRYKKKRLPTEAEWEFAALGGGDRTYSWGDEPPGAERCPSAPRSSPVKPGRYAPNGYGLYDMTGNVWEWTSDRYAKDYYSESDTVNPEGPSVGRYRVIRGGGWYSGAQQLRVRNRQWFAPEYGEVSVGIRCVE